MQASKGLSKIAKLVICLLGICLLCQPSARAFALGQLKVQSELGQKLHALLLLPSQELLHVPNECFRASLRLPDGNLLTTLTVERSGVSGLLLASKQEIKESNSRLVVLNACPNGSSMEYHLQLEASTSLPLPAGNDANSLSPLQAQKRLAQRRAELAQVSSKTPAKPQELSAPSAGKNTGMAKNTNLGPSSPKMLPLMVAHMPAEPISAAPAHTHLMAMEVKLVALDQQLKTLNKSGNTAWIIAPDNLIWLLTGLLGLALIWLGTLFHRMRQMQGYLRQSHQASEVEDMPKKVALASVTPVHSELHPAASPIEYPPQVSAEEFDFVLEPGDLLDFERPASASPQAPLEMLDMLDTPQQGEASTELAELDDPLFVSQRHLASSVPQAEEMHDVLQEAKFWVSIQRVASAIQLLEHETQSSECHHAPSWLYLLDLYRQTQARDQYLALRTRFHGIFNGCVPDWDEADSQLSPRLADLPRLTNKLTQILPSSEGVSYLENLLLDDRNGTRQGFAYGVYCDLVQLLERIKQGDNWQNAFA